MFFYQKFKNIVENQNVDMFFLRTQEADAGYAGLARLLEPSSGSLKA